MLQIHYSHEQRLQLMEVAKGGFDNPSVKYIESDSVFFSGWFLPLEKDIFIQVDYPNGDPQRFYLNQPRPDVVKALSLSDGDINCGFCFFLNARHLKGNENIRVSVHVNERKFYIYAISSPVELSLNAEKEISNFWQMLLDKKDFKAEFFNESHIDYIVDITKERFKLFYNEKEFVFSKLNKNKEISPFSDFDEFNTFLDHFNDNKWSLWAIQEACKLGGLLHKIQNTTIEYKCVRSYSIYDCNYLHCKIRDLDFFVVQHCRNVAIIFPTLAVAINIWIKPWFDFALYCMKSLINEIKRNNISVLNSENSIFLGINITQARPYHFVYDYLHGLEYLSHQGVSCPVINTKGYDFLDIGKIFDNVASFRALSEQEINSQQGFYIAPCWQYIHSDYDRNLISLSTLLKNKANQLINKPLEVQADLYFWVGVSVEKRRWVEQESGIIEIIKKLSERYPSLCVMIDGRTRVMSEAVGANATARAEIKIFEAIKEPFETNQNVSFVSLIGVTMLEKIYWSQYVDTFLTHYMTDSIYVSCIHEKIGVVYSASLPDSQKALHIHHDVLEVQKVIDCSPNEHTYAMKSVSMNWQDVYECIEQVLNKIGK